MSSCGPQSIAVRCWKAKSSRTQTATPPPCAVRVKPQRRVEPFYCGLSHGHFVQGQLCLGDNCNVHMEGVEGVFKITKL